VNGLVLAARGNCRAGSRDAGRRGAAADRDWPRRPPPTGAGLGAGRPSYRGRVLGLEGGAPGRHSRGPNWTIHDSAGTTRGPFAGAPRLVPGRVEPEWGSPGARARAPRRRLERRDRRGRPARDRRHARRRTGRGSDLEDLVVPERRPARLRHPRGPGAPSDRGIRRPSGAHRPAPRERPGLVAERAPARSRNLARHRAGAAVEVRHPPAHTRRARGQDADVVARRTLDRVRAPDGQLRPPGRALRTGPVPRARHRRPSGAHPGEPRS
jgi:hypothetical protein